MITPQTATAVYFEVVTPAGQPLHWQKGSCGLIQFVTHYQHSSGQQRLRVTTIARNFAETGSPNVAASFDQEAAAVLMSCIAVSYTFNTPPTPILLNSVSIKHDVVLLLTTSFHILIFHSELVAQWRPYFSTVCPSNTTLSSSTPSSTFSSSTANLSLNGGIKDIKIKKDTKTLKNCLKSQFLMPCCPS